MKRIQFTILLTRSWALCATLCLAASGNAWAAVQIGVSPGTTAAFGNRSVATTTTQSFTVSNLSPVAVKITAITAPGSRRCRPPRTPCSRGMPTLQGTST